MKNRIRILTFLLATTLAGIAAAQKHTPDSINVLYLGNSYTYYHDLPKTVAEIGTHIGQDQKIKIGYKAFTPGGCTFRRHLENPEVVAAIKKGGWNYVVLQEQSSAPARDTQTVARETYPYAHSLDSLIHVYNPDAKVIFYMTWGHKDGCQSPHEGYPLVDTYDGMQERLKTSYLEMTYANDAWCAPVGMAWKRVREERPYNTLYWPDCSHPSKLGSYLAANVIFSVILRQPYQSHYCDGLDPELAEYVQQTAQQTVFSNLRLLNIK